MALWSLLFSVYGFLGLLSVGLHEYYLGNITSGYMWTVLENKARKPSYSPRVHTTIEDITYKESGPRIYH
jgi:hypothetical protein